MTAAGVATDVSTEIEGEAKETTAGTIEVEKEGEDRDSTAGITSAAEEIEGADRDSTVATIETTNAVGGNAEFADKKYWTGIGFALTVRITILPHAMFAIETIAPQHALLAVVVVVNAEISETAPQVVMVGEGLNTAVEEMVGPDLNTAVEEMVGADHNAAMEEMAGEGLNAAMEEMVGADLNTAVEEMAVEGLNAAALVLTLTVRAVASTGSLAIWPKRADVARLVTVVRDITASAVASRETRLGADNRRSARCERSSATFCRAGIWRRHRLTTHWIR